MRPREHDTTEIKSLDVGNTTSDAIIISVIPVIIILTFNTVNYELVSHLF